MPCFLTKFWHRFATTLRECLGRSFRKGMKKFQDGMQMCHGNNICRPKYNGDLNIIKLWAMNMDMLGKLGLNLAIEDNKLRVKIMRAKYFVTSSFMKCRKKRLYSKL